jgi:hypothetical protein
MNLRSLRFFAVLLASILGLILIGCGGSGDSSSVTTNGSTNGSTDGTNAGQSGTLAVRMSDGLDPSVTAVNVTISRVEANVNGRWVNIPVETHNLNLFDLNDSDILLATGEVPTGDYNQVRVFVDSATVTDDTGVHNVVIPSADKTGIKINVDYRIKSKEVTTLLLDFNADKSLNLTGSGTWMMHPVIPAVVKVLSGTITGTVMIDGAPAEHAHVRAYYTAGSNYEIGTEVNTSWTKSTGQFKIWALLPGTYRLKIAKVNPDGTYKTFVDDVTVAADTNTDIGNVSITLMP